MIKITVIALSRLKEKYLKEACGEYEKRLQGFCELRITEIEPVRLQDNPSEALVLAALEKEAEAIIKKIPSSDKVVALCVEGKRMQSTDFAEYINKSLNLGTNITFIIGSSYGLSSRVKQLADLKLSLSDMTFPHQLFRVMLLEQIYRAFKINQGSTYHK